LEEWLALIHNRPAALVCNSGYDANLCITSCLPVDTIILDELCHNSIYMGVQWNKNTALSTFSHNDVQDLEKTLQKKQHDGVVLVIVESVYSMDGDVAPLKEILDVSHRYGAQVVVDEAHGLGIYGRTNRRDLDESQLEDEANGVGGTGVLAALELESHPALLCSVHTFGKGAGCHGAVLCCVNITLRDYLLNYARPFIYSTALPLHSLVTIKCSYETMINCEERRQQVFALVRLFRELVESMLRNVAVSSNIVLYPSNSPIQALLVPGNDACIQFCSTMHQKYGLLLYPIRAPTVPRGQERVRIILHAHNTRSQVTHLVECMGKTLRQMGLATVSSRL
jgi:8-amino-7-oxononanoate synthase